MSEREKQIARESGAENVVITSHYVLMVIHGQVVAVPKQ